MSHVVNNTTANNVRAAGGLRGDISNEFEGLAERLPLSSKFDTARDEDAYEKVRTRLEREGRTAEGQPSLADQVRGLQMGTLDVKDVSNANALGAAGQYILLKEKLKADRERATSDALFYALLDQLADRLREVESRISTLQEALKEKYGDNVPRGMAQTYCTPEELVGADSEQDYVRLLVDKFYDEQGDLLPAASSLPAEDLALIQEYKAGMDIAHEINRVSAEHGHEPSPELEQLTKKFVDETSYSNVMRVVQQLDSKVAENQVQEAKEERVFTEYKDADQGLNIFS